MLTPPVGSGFSPPGNFRRETAGAPVKLYRFDNMLELPDDFTFTRGTHGWYFDSSGTLRRAPHNLVGRSHDLENWTSINANHTAANGVAANPVDGATTAFRLTRSGSSGNSGSDTQYTITDKIYTGDKISVSMYFKNETLTSNLRMQVRGSMIADQLGFIGVSFDETGAVTSNAANDNDSMSYTALDDGWYYLEGTFTAVADDTDGWTIGLTAGGSGDEGNSYLGYGVQVEINDVARPLIVTTGGNAKYDGPRFDHVYDGSAWQPKGLLIEGARTNSVLQNRDFSTTWVAIAGSPTSASATGIDGTTRTIRLGDDNAASQELWGQDVTIANDGATHSGSMFVGKRTVASSTFPRFGITLQGGTVKTEAISFDPYNGDVSETNSNGTYSVQDYGDWWRLNFTLTNNTTGNTALRIFIYPAYSNSLGGSNTSSTGTVDVDFCQVELNASFPSSPIETGASTVTRNADVCTLTGLDTAGWYNQSEGTVLAEWRVDGLDANARVLEFKDAAEGERISLTWTTAHQLSATVVDNAVTQSNRNLGTLAVDTDHKAAAFWKLNDAGGVANGGTVSNDTSATMPTVDRLEVMRRAATADTLFGHISRIAYWGHRLTDDALVGLTR